MVESLLHDLRYSIRSLSRTPGLMLWALLMLSSGIGATAAVFSVVDRTILRPLPYKDPDRLVSIHEVLPVSATPESPVSALHFEEWRTATRSFEEMALLFPGMFTLGGASDPEQVGGVRASASLLPMLGARMQHGRTFSGDEEVLGRHRVAVLAHDLWTRRFGADISVVGRQVHLDGDSYTVIGVLAPDFEFPNPIHLYPMAVATDRVQIWLPLGLRPFERSPSTAFNFACIARLKPHISATQALQDVDAVQREIGRRLPGSISLRASVVPLHEQLTGSSRRGLELLLATAGVVLFVLCVNIATLFLTRGMARQHEFAVLQAGGATRRRLIQVVLLESLVIATAAGILGAAMTPTLIRLILFSAPVDLPMVGQSTHDAHMPMFTALLSLMCAAVVGVLPAWRASAVAPIVALKAASTRTTHGAALSRIASLFVAVEVGASTACLVVAGLLVASLSNLLHIDRGFNEEHIVTGLLRLPASRYDVDRASSFLRTLKQAVGSIPGVESVGLSDRVPLSGEGGNLPLAPEGTTLPRLQRPVASLQLADGDYFASLGIRVVQGRVFEEADRMRTPVAVVAASAAAHIWPDQNPIGKRFRIGPDTSPLIEIVGVVGDVRSVRLDSGPRLSVYLPYWSTFVGQASLIVRTAAPASTIAPALRATLRQLDPELVVPAFQPIEDIISQSVRMQRFQMNLTLLFSAAAVAMTAVGIYGTLSHSVKGRTPEIGVRMALGAEATAVCWMILGQALRPAAMGMAAGFGVFLAIAPQVRALLFGISATDPRTLALTAVLLGTVAVVAAYLPSRRAARVSPSVAMRPA
jgi:predicted permease